MAPLPRLASVLLLAAALGGCLDLELPAVPPDGGVGPTLTVHTPQPGATIALDAPVNVEAESVNGVASVTVTCGSSPSTGVFTWNVAPYTGVIDFTRCTLVATGVTDGGIGQLQLTFIGVDTLGHTSSQSFPVLLDTSSAILSVAIPDRVVPGTPLRLTVGSDRPLQLPPSVRLISREADGIVQRANPDGGPPFYDVTFTQAPGLGIDLYTGDPLNVPFEVLSDIERSVSLTIDGRATNGNSTHLERNVLLSRVAWDRAVPGRIALAPAAPVATSVGVHLALASTDPNPGNDAGVVWLPGLFRAGDGTYVPFDPGTIRVLDALRQGTSVECTTKLLAGTDGRPPLEECDGGVLDPDAGQPFPPDAGYLALDFDARGHVVFARGSRTSTEVLAIGEPGPTTPVRPATVYSLPFPVSKPLTRVDDLLCLPDIFTGNEDGCWYAPASQSLLCFAGADGTLALTTGSSPTQTLGAPNPGGTAGAHGAQRTYLSPNDTANCGPAWGFLGPANLFALQSRTASPFGACFQETVTRLLPIPDGSFAVSSTLDCGTQFPIPGDVVTRVGPTGTVVGTYLAKQDVVLPAPPPTLLATLADGRLVTMRNVPPFTLFEAWPSDGSPPTTTATVPGLYVYAGGGRLASDVAAASDGSLTVLLNNATLGDVVLHFGPGLTPRWLYRYQRIVQNSSLVAGDEEGTVYYVDPLNNEIVALRRF